MKTGEVPTMKGFAAPSETAIRPGEVALGWLRFTCDVQEYSVLIPTLERIFQTEIKERGKGWNGYLMSYQGRGSLLIGLTPRLTQLQREDLGIKKSPNEGYMTVDIPQTLTEELSLALTWELWSNVLTIDSVKLTRVDIYYDDFERLLHPQQLEEMVLAGKVGVPRCETMKDFGRVNLRTGKQEGKTLYFGSEKSEKQVRFYDKEAESGGERKCNRIEVQLSHGKAQAFQKWLYSALDDSLNCTSVDESGGRLTQAYRETIAGAIDFRDISGRDADVPLPSNWATRFPRLAWYEKILCGVRKADLRVGRVNPSLQGTVAWLRRQVFPAIALVKTAYQNWGMPWFSWLERELEEGEARWNDSHWFQLEQALIHSPAY